jgi:hypothetical protein
MLSIDRTFEPHYRLSGVHKDVLHLRRQDVLFGETFSPDAADDGVVRADTFREEVPGAAGADSAPEVMKVTGKKGELVVDAESGKVTQEMLRAENKAEVLLTTEENRGVSWEEWKAAVLNRLFQEQGVIGERDRITAATVGHGEKERAVNIRPRSETCDL